MKAAAETLRGMSLSRSRLLPSALALAAVALLAAGCATTPVSPAPTSTSGSDAGSGPSEHTANDIEAAWLDAGHSIGIVTWGSSSSDCRPGQVDARADGQTIRVMLVDQGDAEAICTDDLVPRATLIAVPEGVDVTKQVTIDAAYGDVSDEAILAALESDVIENPEPMGVPSAGWFDDAGIVLLTWGSSTCPLVVEDVAMTDAGATVTFASPERVCTMDLAPRVTAITLPEPRADDSPFPLTLTGDHLDAEVDVIG